MFRHLGTFFPLSAALPVVALCAACVGGDKSGAVNETGGAAGRDEPAETGGTKGTGGTGGTKGTGGSTTHSGGTTSAGGTTGSGGTSTATGSATGTGGSKGTGGRRAGSGGATRGESGGGAASGRGGSSAEGGSGGTNSGRAGGTVDGGSSSAAGSSGGDAATGEGGDNRSPGCGKAITRPNPKTQQTMVVGGATRYYLLDVPSNADNKTPLMLIFGLHGFDMNNVAVIDRYDFTSRSGGKAITVMPQGEGPAPGDVSHWGDQVLKSTWVNNDANYTFLHTLMTDLEDRFCIDKNRVFIAGFSMGGFFTSSLACAHGDWFRAFAPISGGLFSNPPCANASAKPPIMIHHGTADPVVEFSNGETVRDYWTKQNGCSQTNKSSYTGCQSFDGCAQPVIFCVGSWDHDITKTAVGNIWTFFNSFE